MERKKARQMDRQPRGSSVTATDTSGDTSLEADTELEKAWMEVGVEEDEVVE